MITKGGKNSLTEFLTTNRSASQPPEEEALKVAQEAAQRAIDQMARQAFPRFEAAAPVSGVGAISTQGVKIAASAAPGAADRMVGHLREHGPMSAAALLRALEISVEEGAQALERLERFGLIQRTESAGGDVLLRAAD